MTRRRILQRPPRVPASEEWRLEYWVTDCGSCGKVDVRRALGSPPKRCLECHAEVEPRRLGGLYPVVQDWVMRLPWKMQSVLMTSARGPDQFRYPAVKIVGRWIRGYLFHDADPSNPFIHNPLDQHAWEDVDNLLSVLEHELEYLALHYYGHLIHALQIIGYKHPDEGVRLMAGRLYRELCQRVLHLPFETEEQMDLRLRGEAGP